ncbi:AEC family transporter [Gracilinema caldarium]|uniref:Auxin Efflux Carrier n=1 Tax=Gracilinema caldarium (strain ATCC 51460 / DSM 7334 / H1) TaxID=744872 RepID=F8F333_GRAC1|nr:auxin efflux carrier [Gracilinema caldarium]AEJ20359.1 Auxin Efflux Carrier [Gracilinema caldarium DSM 7334]
MDELGLLSQFLPIIVLVLLGAVLGKREYITFSMIEGLKRIVSSISLPALLFLAFSRISINGRLGILALSVFVSCGLLGFAAIIPAKLFSLPRQTTVFLFQGFEAGMLGYALFTTLYGTQALPAFASADLGQVLYVFTILMFQLQTEHIKPHQRGRQSLGTIVLGMLKSPVMIAIISGLISSTFVPQAQNLPWGDRGFLYPLFSTIGSMTTPLVSLVVGFGLKDLSLQNLGKSVLLIISRLVAVILVGLGITLLILPRLGYGPLQALALMTLFILPPPFIIPVFKTNNEDGAFISTVLSLHTLVALLLAFIIALIWGNNAGLLSGVL